ncbi:hypothetical protein D920_00839 [Enterococcus faecalis 13-SD-W-01]|nr:hypothetical protein D920_00839 [Enterococcus faecalis 13-SD-W-01]
MKKWLFGKSVFAVLVSLVASNGIPVTASSHGTNSEGTVRLEENRQTTDPKNPTDPSRPQQPDPNNPPTNNRGPLSLDVAPKGFYFGNQKMYHTEHEYQAQGKENHIQYLQVSDNRDEGIYGWMVKVRQDGYLRDEESGHELKGAVLTLPKGGVRNSNDSKESGLRGESVEITKEEQTIFSAPADKSVKAGKATSTYFWQSQEATLTIPRNTARAGEYSKKIYWILMDGGPEN